ncbi:MAG: Bax inhibitor-1 family protein [Clostridiales bacterium]
MDRTMINQNVLNVSTSERAEFIRKTYMHLALAILGFVALEYVLLQQVWITNLIDMMTGGMNWLIVMGAFMLIGWIADKWARSSVSKSIQYIGLFLYVIAEAFIFIPLLYFAMYYTSPDVIPTAGMITGLLFIGLTFIVFTTNKDFSFLGSILKIAFFVALGIIIASVIFGFTIGLLFSAIMVILASASILYTTSQIQRHYSTEQYVAASLSLFASVALLFWYVLRIVISIFGND